MAPQGHGAGASGQEGACENSNLERQGCGPFYQELIEDPYVDAVRSVSVLIIFYSPVVCYFSSLKTLDRLLIIETKCLYRLIT